MTLKKLGFKNCYIGLNNTDGYFCGQPDIKVSDFSSIYISLSNVNFFSCLLFLWHVLHIVEIQVVWRRGSWVSVIQLCKEKHKIEVQNGCIFFIKIYKQVIFQHECIVSPVQSASGKALHYA